MGDGVRLSTGVKSDRIGASPAFPGHLSS